MGTNKISFNFHNVEKYLFIKSHLEILYYGEKMCIVVVVLWTFNCHSGVILVYRSQM